MITKEDVQKILNETEEPCVTELYDAAKGARKIHYTSGFIHKVVEIAIEEIDNEKREDKEK